MDKMTPERVMERLREQAEKRRNLASAFMVGHYLRLQDEALAAEYEAMAETVRTIQGERDGNYIFDSLNDPGYISTCRCGISRIDKPLGGSLAR